MMPLPAVHDCRLIALPYHDDERGNLTVLERGAELPFDIRRATLISNVPPGGSRGHHANMLTSELILCASGALTVRVEDGQSSRSIPISSRAGAVLVPPALWLELRDFAPGTVVLVLADTDFREARHAYIRDHASWLEAREAEAGAVAAAGKSALVVDDLARLRPRPPASGRPRGPGRPSVAQQHAHPTTEVADDRAIDDTPSDAGRPAHV